MVTVAAGIGMVIALLPAGGYYRLRRYTDMATAEYAVKIDGLKVNYGGQRVLNGFSARVSAGEKVLLTGPSGCGKSTVLKCVLGLVVPRAGSIRVFDQLLTADSVWRIRRRMAYVAQEPDLGGGTVRAALERPFNFKANAARRDNLRRLPMMMERVNLQQSLLDKDVASLSGGEKQRIALISAVMLDREIILLDEAASALDGANREASADLIGKAGNLSVLAVAHADDWPGLASRVIAMGRNSQRTDEGR